MDILSEEGPKSPFGYVLALSILSLFSHLPWFAADQPRWKKTPGKYQCATYPEGEISDIIRIFF